jgi:poly[(R)-3-hydroxyalkanoate] polymerase subunit PhaC
MRKAAARSAKLDARSDMMSARTPSGEKGDTPRSIGAAADLAEDREDGSTRTASEKLSGQFGIGNFVPGDLPEIGKEVVSRAARQPIPLFQASLGFMGELVKIAVGQSSLAPDSADKRFSDPAWRESWIHKRLLQSYLAWGSALQQYVRDASPDAREAQRASFLASQIIDAMAPTNALLFNPSATKRLIETGGESLVRGLSNLMEDVGKGRVIPSQSDDRPFKVGENLAATPGSVVLRTEIFELIQYAPQTPSVFERPFLFVPALVNKFYVFDLAPGRSLFEYFIKNSVTFFSIAWRNPSPEHDHWGVEEYGEAVDQAIATVLEITGAKDVNLWAVCGASPVVAALVAYYVATQQRKVNSLGFLVPILDLATLANTEGIGPFIGQKKTGARAARRRAGRMSARDFGLLFALLRSNDLIWNYWVSNYLIGNDPPKFDILTWNNDGTGMTAKFNEEFGEMIEKNPLLTPGAMRFRDAPIAALDKLGIDSYVVGAATDHICRWASVYRSALVLGERCEFVLGSSGHIQTLVCPPGNPKSGYFTNTSKPISPDQWLQTAQKHVGTWWDHCLAWLGERSGKRVPAPPALGSAANPPIGRAPGVYVLEKI